MDNIYTALALVEAGLGVSLFPASIQGQKRKGVVFRELQAPVPRMECAVVYARNAESKVLQLFLSVVRDVAAKHRVPRRRARSRATAAYVGTRPRRTFEAVN
jgi:DNA-binding transcriptional LysR family regulator